MKILLLNHFPLVGSGSGVYVHNIAKSMVEKGHQVCIIMPENSTNINCEDSIKIHPVYFKREEIIEGQLDFNFPCMDPHPRSNLLFEQMTERQIQEYVNAFKKALEEEIKEFNPDIIHAQHIWILSGLLKQYGIPYVITSHGAEFITYKRTHRFDSFGMDAADGCKKIIAISDDNIKEISEKFPNVTDKIIYLKNGYNSTDFYKAEFDKKEILNSLGIEKMFDKIVFFVGRLSKLKGLDTLLKAAKIYQSDNVLTLIAGDGEYKNELELLIKEWNLKNIVFLGNRNHKELNCLYNIADVLVLPSRKEALPLVAIEAMACGTPVVVSNISGMSDIVKNDIGLLFDVEDEKMLANQINRILKKEIVFDYEKIINHAKNNYSQDKLIEKLTELYEETRRQN